MIWNMITQVDLQMAKYMKCLLQVVKNKKNLELPGQIAVKV